MKYTQEEIFTEILKRMSSEALEFFISLGTQVTFHMFEEEWNKKFPNKSFFDKKTP